MKRLGMALLLLLFTALPALAAFQQDQWQYFREIRSEKDGFTLIATDRDILAKSQKGLLDIRLTAEDGREIPYQAVRKEQPKENLYPVTIINSVIREDTSSLTLDLSQAGLLHNQISLDIENSEDYLRDVLLEGSNDNQTWHAIALKDKLFFVPPDIKKKDLSYTPASFRYLRLTIDCREKKPLKITGARVNYRPPAESPVSPALPANQLASRNDTKTNSTEIIMDLGAGGYQIDYIDLISNGENFYRQVDIYQSDDQKEWSLLASDRIYHYQWEDYRSQDSAITIGGPAERYIKVAVHNQNSPPLDIKAGIYGEAPRLLAGLSTGKYRLWYGNPRGEQPQYDLSQFSHLINTNSLETISPGPEQLNPSYKERISPQTSRMLLNVAVILAAVVIGIILLRNLRQRPS
jgi:hypothetical protein